MQHKIYKLLFISFVVCAIAQMPLAQASSKAATTTLTCSAILNNYLNVIENFRAVAREIAVTMTNSSGLNYKQSDIKVVQVADQELSKTPTHNDFTAEYAAIKYMFSHLSPVQQGPLVALMEQLQQQVDAAHGLIDPWGGINSNNKNNQACKDLYYGCDLGEKGCDKKDSMPTAATINTTYTCAQIINDYIGAVGEFLDTGQGMLAQMPVGSTAAEPIKKVVASLKDYKIAAPSYSILKDDYQQIKTSYDQLPADQQGLLKGFLKRLKHQLGAAHHRIQHWGAVNATINNATCSGTYKCQIGDPGCDGQRLK